MTSLWIVYTARLKGRKKKTTKNDSLGEIIKTLGLPFMLPTWNEENGRKQRRMLAATKYHSLQEINKWMQKYKYSNKTYVFL